jgi:hypothetical protein
LLCLWKKSSWRCPEMVAPPGLAASFILISLTLLCFTEGLAAAQSSNAEKGVPILSGSAGTFSFVTAGQQRLDAQINPVLLVPLGDRWLVESRAGFEGAFQRPPDGGPYGGPVSKNLDYLFLALLNPR